MCKKKKKKKKEVHRCAAAAAAMMLLEARVTLFAWTPLGGANEQGRLAQANVLMGVSASVLAMMNGEHLRCSRKAARLKGGEREKGEE